MVEPGSYVRDDNFRAKYANNVQIDLTVWDLSVIFGKLAKVAGGADLYVQQHTSVTMSWLQAKLLAAFLFLNVDQHEGTNGPIRIPKGLLPSVLSEDEAAQPLVDMFSNVVKRARDVQESAREVKPAVGPKGRRVTVGDEE